MSSKLVRISTNSCGRSGCEIQCQPHIMMCLFERRITRERERLSCHVIAIPRWMDVPFLCAARSPRSFAAEMTPQFSSRLETLSLIAAHSHSVDPIFHSQSVSGCCLHFFSLPSLFFRIFFCRKL